MAIRSTATVLFAFQLASLPLGNAQTPPEKYVPQLQLRVKEKLPISSLVGNLRGIHIRCDDNGNLYYRPAESDWSGPIMRVSADGHKVTTIDLKLLPDFGDSDRIVTWTSGLRGEVHVIAYNKEGHPCLLTFDDEGELQSSGNLDSQFIFFHLAVFPTGELLAAGIRETGESEALGEPYTAIFDRNGKLIKELSFPGDVKTYSAKAQGNDSKPSGAPIALGDAVPAADGNIYLMRKTEKHLLFVISPAGEVVRKLNLVPTRDGWDWQNFFVAGGKVVVESFKGDSAEQTIGATLYSVYDADSSERQLDYEITPEISGPLVCYTPNQFTFMVTQDDRGSAIIHAIPK
jgi:hypothetical protein